MPTVSVVIVSWNGKRWLERCLASLMTQTVSDYEILFVDNGSSDGSPEFVKERFPAVMVVESPSNLGFAGGNNLGIRKAKGEYILLLNNDTVVENDLIEKLLLAFEEIPGLGAVNPKIVLMDGNGKLDNCGSFWTRSTFLYHYGYGRDGTEPEFNTPIPVFYNNGSAMMVRKELFERFGFIDDDFWCYNEEGDFCHRLWLAGYECWYYPKTTVSHAKGSTSSRISNQYVQFHNYKNRLLSYIKNFEARTLAWVLPVSILMYALVSAYWLLRGRFKEATAIFRAIWWNVVNIRRTLAKRKSIQSHRVKSDSELSKVVTRSPELSYYYSMLKASVHKET